MDNDHLAVWDDLWEKIASLLPHKPEDREVTGRNIRRFMEIVYWRVRKGVPRRDLPGEFGKWNTVFKRFR